MHIATGGSAGALLRSRVGAVAAGLALHALCDRIPHEDLASRRFEAQCGVGGILALALVRGPLDPATIGAIASAAPDLEHVLPFPRPGGRKLFPSHRIPGFHRPGGISAPAQLVIAGVLLGVLLAQTGRGRSPVYPRSRPVKEAP